MKRNIAGMILGVMVLTATACGSTSADSTSEGTKFSTVESTVESTADSQTSEAEVSEEAPAEPETEPAAETTAAEAVSETAADGLDPDLVAFLDSYEAAMNQYCDFMEKYNSASATDQAGMLADYAQMVATYSDFAAKADAYDEDDLSNEELAYYMDVMNRVNKRLLEVAE